MTASLAVFGNLTIDDLVFPDGSTRWAVPGGSAVYAAMGISLWTGCASIVAPVGTDYPIELLGNRIDLSRCQHVPRTLRNWGLYEEDGQRHFISRNATRNWSEFCPKQTDVASGYQTAAHIAPMPHDLALELVSALRKVGTSSISLDLDDHDLLGRTNLEAILGLLGGVDLFLPSHQDALAIFPGAEPLEGLRRLRSYAPDVTLIAMKCGSEGVIAHVSGAKECIHVPAVQVDLVDPTGAGDAFCGGVLAGFAEKNDPIEALLYGAVSASFCVEGIGFAGLANATEEMARPRLATLQHRVEFQSM
ncbi:carbohydrate kinase family protein [Edaphobacter modestus]|uniref:Sugar/nucleoside kinase (Ribokinase family) n=1 Tax=Edaphobacter modestus TaxID=388466 RepID=A0A4Q7YPT7_9BACT|nr:PfkB family carbohydrate kinase [Edaphobacter modestus]RZU38873.1 sugar/nucleoside kinase (ribokinase family) [Edaphobacter modestus]